MPLEKEEIRPPKQRENNPLLKMGSTNAERLNHVHPVAYFKGRKHSFENVIEWLKHLESDRNPNQELKSSKQLEADRKTLFNFWDYARRRAEVIKLLNTDLSESEIAKKINISRERVRQLVNDLMPNRLKGPERERLRKQEQLKKLDYKKKDESLSRLVARNVNPRFSQIASIDDVINSQRGLLESFSGLTGNERKEAMQRALKITRTRAEVEHLLRTTDLSESEIARQLGLRPDLIYRMKKTLMPGRPTQISKAYERREREREEKEQKPKQAQQTKPIKKNNLAPTKKVDATKEAKKRQYITEKKEEIKTNSNIATIRNALSKYGVSFKALIEIYSVMDIPVERGGFLFVKVSADIGEINTRMVYQKLSQTFSTDSLILIEMDRLWGINPERLIRNPDGIRNIAIRNLKEFGIIR